MKKYKKILIICVRLSLIAISLWLAKYHFSRGVLLLFATALWWQGFRTAIPALFSIIFLLLAMISEYFYPNTLESMSLNAYFYMFLTLIVAIVEYIRDAYRRN